MSDDEAEFYYVTPSGGLFHMNRDCKWIRSRDATRRKLYATPGHKYDEHFDMAGKTYGPCDTCCR